MDSFGQVLLGAKWLYVINPNVDLTYVKEKRGDDTIGWFECLSAIAESAADQLGVREEDVFNGWMRYRETLCKLVAEGQVDKTELVLRMEFSSEEDAGMFELSIRYCLN